MLGVPILQQIQAFDNTLFHALGHLRVGIVFIHGGNVIENRFLFLVHAAQAVLDNNRQFIGIGRIVADAIGNGAGKDMAVAVLVLQTFPVQGGPAGGGANQKPPGLQVSGGPAQVADALEAEHGVVDIKGYQQLALLILAVVHHLAGVGGVIKLAPGGINTNLPEQTLHTEGAGLIRYDRDQPAADFLVLEQCCKDSHEGHGGGNFPVSGPVQLRLKGIETRYFKGFAVGAALGNFTAKLFPLLAHVDHFLAVVLGAVVGNFVQFFIGDGDAEAITENLKFFQAQFLRLMGSVLPFHRGKGIPLDGLGENYRRPAGGVHGLLVGGINLEGVVPATVKLHDVIVGQVLHHFQQFRALAEEVFPGIGAATAPVSLEFTVHGFIHAGLQDAVSVLGQQAVPVTSPHYLDDIPARTAKDTFKFLDDLAIAAHGTVQALQVAVNHENQVVQLLPPGQADGAEAFRLVALPVSQEGPYLAVAFLYQVPLVQILHYMGLIDGLQGAKAHGDGWELPVIMHQPGMGI